MPQATKTNHDHTSTASVSLGSKRATNTGVTGSSTTNWTQAVGPAVTRYSTTDGTGKKSTVAHISGAYDSEAEEVRKGLLFGTEPRFYTAAEAERRKPGGQSGASGTGSSQ